MPSAQRGAISGIATTTKGWALIFGPLVAGALIDASGSHLQATNGYQVLWPFCAVLVLGSIPIVARVWRTSRAEDAPVIASGTPAGR